MNEKRELESQLTLRLNRVSTLSKSLLLTIISLLTIFSYLLSSKTPLFTNLIDAKYEPSKNNDLILRELLEPLKNENLASKWLKAYSEENQLAGTNLEMVNYTLARFIELGLTDSYVDQYTSLISYPLENSLSLIDSQNSSVVYKPSLIEDELSEDKNSVYNVPAFLGYAANGNVTAQFVYCNYGTFEDFQKLSKLGVDLKDKIAIVRYGKIFRGLKVKFAQDFDMAAVLIYTDTFDDGEVTTQNGYEPYPNGFARNPSAIQRGSAQFLSMTPGDPTTPGYAIKPGDEDKFLREDPYDRIPKIPALPISYKEVQPILSKLTGFGPKVDGWTGLVDGFDYSIGPNPDFELNLYNKQDFNITVMNNIMGKITGRDDSKILIIGNHHDSWTPAAGDPHSGSATLLEIIRAFGELLKTGWVPEYSIIFASWDGEEYGLIGSTEFGEYYEKTLKRKCIAYINSDVATIGSILKMSSSPLLHKVLLESAQKIEYPKEVNGKPMSLYDHFLLENDGKIGTLGSGSDYTVFLDHLAIPSVDLGFTNDLKNSSVYQYHSLYDSYYWMEKFGDPGFVYHNLMAQFMSTIILNLADEPILNLRTNDYAYALEEYYARLRIPDDWLHGEDHKLCGNKTPGFYLNELVQLKLSDLKDSTLAFDQSITEVQKLLENWENLSYWQKIKLHFRIKKINLVLQHFERHLIDESGLDNRPWFKHFVYASGRYTGYKGQELPGLAEAIEDSNYPHFLHKLEKFDNILQNLIRMTTY